MVTRRPAHDRSKGPVGRAAYTHGCRCQECTDANAAYGRDQRAAKRASAASTEPVAAGPGTWADGPSEPGSEPAGECPECGQDELTWTTGRAGVQCQACGYVGRSPDIERRTQHAHTERVHAARAQVVDRGAARRAARELRGTKAELISQIEKQLEDNRKRLSPRGISDIRTFLEDIEHAADEPELMEIMREYRAHPWKERKNRFYNFRTDPDEITGDNFYRADNPADNQCEVYLAGESECESDGEWEVNNSTDENEIEIYWVCSRHYRLIWPDEYHESTRSDTDTQAPTILGMLGQMAQTAIPAPPLNMNAPVRVTPDIIVRRCFTSKGQPDFIGSDKWPPVSQRATGSLVYLITRNAQLLVNVSAAPGYCAYYSGALCMGEADYQIYAPDIDNNSVIWACAIHAMQIGMEIIKDRISRRPDWIMEIRERYYIHDSPMGMCQLEPRTGVSSGTGPCQRAADMNRSLGGIRMCPHHSRALMQSMVQGYMPANMTELANRLNYS